jgi:fucose permease
MVGLLLGIIYLSFISLGLPDSLLGAVWPTLHTQINVPLSYAGIIQMLIAGSTVISSLQSDRLTKKFGTGKVTAFSVMTTAIALFGFSISSSFTQLMLWAIPYGLGAGSVDAALNNYVALHYKSRHMSWLHCMWGVGATLGPLLISYALFSNKSWSMGYRYVFYIQIILTVILFLSLPLWIKNPNQDIKGSEKGDIKKALKLKEILAIPGTKEVMIAFFCYCAIEQTTCLWASSYLVQNEGLSAQSSASFAGLFFLGITIGRAISGFITIKLNNNQMIRLGLFIIAIGIVIIMLPLSSMAAYIGLIVIGLGCAPIYPSIIHSTPANFGADKSQAIIGVQMASAYIGSFFAPSFFGFLSRYLSLSFLPFYLTFFLIILFVSHGRMLKKTLKNC